MKNTNRTGKTLTSLLLAGALGLSACNDYEPRSVSAEASNSKGNYETLRGKPLGVGESSARAYGAFSIVIDNGSKKILAKHESEGLQDSDYTKRFADAQALVESEINDGDDDLVEVDGRYDGTYFRIVKLRAQGYEVDFR